MDRLSSPKRSHALVYLILAVLLTFSCVLPGTPTQTPEPKPTEFQQEPLPPVLTEVSPLDGSQLGYEQSITFYFSQPMDRASVEDVLFGLPDGSRAWSDDSTLTFTPDQPYTTGTDLTVAILTSAEAANGMHLAAPITLTYHTASLLRPINFLPEPDSQDIDSRAAVAVTFNQPVVPLGAEADPSTGSGQSLPEAFSLSPSVEGRGEWLSTSTYVFDPEPALAGGETYTVNLNTDLVSTVGASLDLANSTLAWSFETALPRLVSVEPSNEQTLALDTAIKLTFNQPMDPASMESGFLFLGGGASVDGKVSWSDDNTVMTFEPDELLERNSAYTLILSNDAKAASGTPIALEQQYEFFTYGEFRVHSNDPVEGGAKNDNTNVQVYFTAPPKGVDNLEDYVRLSPEVSNLGVFLDGTTLHINGYFLPESEYTLTISPELVDAWDQPLGSSFELNFRTVAATPSLNIPFWGNVYFVRPDEPVLKANATNIRRADVTIAPIPFSDFQLLTGPTSYEVLQTYEPQSSSTHSQSYTLAPSRSEPVDLPLTEAGDELATGFYHVIVDSPELNQGVGGVDFNASARAAGPEARIYLVVASNVNLTFKVGATDALLWATDLRTDEPVSAAFKIYDNNGIEVASAQTDAQGLWHGELPVQEHPGQAYTAVLSEPGQADFGAAQTSWSAGVSPWEFGVPLSPRPPEPEMYLYTDRPIYRPGQTVYFRGAVRQAFNGRYELPDFASVSLKLQDTNGLQLQTFDLLLSPYGTFHGEYQLSPEADPGYYSLTSDELQAYLSFNVAEYRKPEIELNLAFEQDQAGAGEQVRAESEARYYFGSPAGNVDVQWYLYEQPTYFYLPGYQTGVIDDDWLVPNWARGGNFGSTLEDGTTRTEADGKLILDFSNIPDAEAPRTLTLEMTVQDESGFPVSARDELTVHPANFYIGLRPDQWVGQSGTALGFDVFTADWERNPSPSKPLQAEFKKVRWERKDPPLEAVYDIPTYEPVYTLVSSSNLSTGRDGKARLSFTAQEPGTYILEVFGGGARTQVLLWVKGGQFAGWPSLLNDQVKLTTDQETYLPGQTAKIFIPNPFGESVQALVSVERGKILRAELLELDPSGSTYSLDLTDEHAPNVYFAATLLGPDNQFRQGYVDLEVAPTAQELQVELTAEPEINEPRGELTLKLRVTDSAGEPVNGEFSLSVVDKAVLALADPNSPDILPAYYGKQSLGILTGLSLAAYSGRYVIQPGGRGGGGGDGGIVPVREEFPDTAFWNPSFITDSNGMGQVTLTLPDSLTTWFIETRGLTTDTRVGQATTEVVTTKQLLVRPVAPRFLVTGDHVELSAIVHNNTSAAVEATVSLDATGFLLDEPGRVSQTVEIPAHGRNQVSWWGTAGDAELADLVFAASATSNGRRLNDAAKPALGPLPIYAYVAPQTFVTAGMLSDGGEVQEIISLPRSFSPSGGGLDVEMSPSLAASLLQSLEALPMASCTCNNEEVLSYFLPNLETQRALQASGVDDPVLKERLDKSLSEGITTLIQNQNNDGGWSWIRGGDSDPYISTYVLFGLGRARLEGVSVPDEPFDRAHEYLRTFALADPTLGTYQSWELDRLTFALFALGQSSGLQEADWPVLNTMYDKRDQLSPWAQALLALSLEEISSGDDRARDLVANLEATAIRTGSSSNWESDFVSWRNPGTPLYTTAVAVYALAQRDPAAPVLIEAVRYLSSNRGAHSLWGSSYENAWVILALTEAMKGFGELQADFSFSAELNNAPLATGDVSGTDIFAPVSASVPLEFLSLASPNALVISRESGLGRLYYRASLTLNRPVESVQPLNKGMDVNRVYYDGNCVTPTRAAKSQSKDCPPLSTLQLAPDSRLTARLTLTLPNDSYYVMLEDFIPAGTEILNQELKTSQLGEDGTEVQVIYDPDDPFSRGWGWWLFDEPQIHDDRITWTADYLPAGTYELTYTLIPIQAGKFRVLPAHAWQAFFPDVQGTSAGMIFEITAK